MKRLSRRKMKKAPPANGALRPAPPLTTLLAYDEQGVRERTLRPGDELLALRGAAGVTWINIDGIEDGAWLETVAGHFGLHPLVLEDIQNPDQRPKVDFYPDYVYLVLKMLSWNEAAQEVHGEQVSLILGPNYVLSFQEDVGDLFDPIREKIRKPRGRLSHQGADGLLHALLDAVVDHYFVILEKLGEQVEALEEELLDRPAPATLHAVHRLRREMIYLRRSIWPLREVIQALQREETPLIRPAIEMFLRDLYDHTLRIMDTVETFRDMLAGMLDIYLSSVSNKLNQVMKVLTIIATIFIPLTFLAGVYGMNFTFMPELRWKYGYYGLWGVMLVSAAGMLYAFRRKGWL